MFNDLRGMKEIRDNYQFWFYMYPTGQPFWISFAAMASVIMIGFAIAFRDPVRLTADEVA